MVTASNPMKQRYIDLEDTIAISGSNMDYSSDRADIRSFDELDGEPPGLEMFLAYKTENGNPNVQRVAAILS